MRPVTQTPSAITQEISSTARSRPVTELNMQRRPQTISHPYITIATAKNESGVRTRTTHPATFGSPVSLIPKQAAWARVSHSGVASGACQKAKLQSVSVLRIRPTTRIAGANPEVDSRMTSLAFVTSTNPPKKGKDLPIQKIVDDEADEKKADQDHRPRCSALVNAVDHCSAVRLRREL